MRTRVFRPQRRRIVAAGMAAAVLPLISRRALSQSGAVVVDGAGREVKLPSRVERIYSAGPPASALTFAVAPDKMIGWTAAWRDAEKAYIPEKYLKLPVLGRLTGRGNTRTSRCSSRRGPM